MNAKQDLRFSRRSLLKSGAALPLALAAKANTNTGAKASRDNKPNILFLMTDQHRGDCLGADGNTRIHTPNLDRLAHEGARFSAAYSCTPTCTPARAALLTGMGPWRNGMLGYGKVAEEYPVEMPRLLREAGYHTLGVGKMHWHPQRCLHGFHKTILDESGREQTPEFRSDYHAWFASMAPHLAPDATGIGWNDYRAKSYALPEELHPTRWAADVAVRFLEGYERTDPFFLKVSFERPHSPYDPPKRWMDHYVDADLPEACVGDWAAKYAKRSDDSFNIWHGELGAEQVRHSRQGYYGSISFIDEQIGRILETLEERGMLDNTLILMTADHGDMMGDHHLWRKSYAYEGSARIPMLMRWPKELGLAGGMVFTQPVELRDVLPTFLDAAEKEPPLKLDGRSMLDLVRGKGEGWRDYIDLEHDICYHKTNHWCALTDGKTKYIHHAYDGEEQLFDLVGDPGETKDLSGDTAHAPTLAAWRKRLATHLEERGPDWVKNGQPVPRPERILYSPNYPAKA